MKIPRNKVTSIIAILIWAASMIWSTAEAQHPDDQYWSYLAFPEWVGPPHGDVTAVAVRGNELIVATAWVGPMGMFSGSAITRWDGSKYDILASDPGAESPDSWFYCLDFYNDELVAGGSFNVGYEGRTYVGRWDGTGWYKVGSDVNGTVNAMTVYGSDLVVGGYFDSAGGDITPGIARWNGENWHGLGSGVVGHVASLEIYDGGLIVSGDFDTAGGVSVDNIARWDGSSWQPLGSGTDGIIYDMHVYESELIVVGNFDDIGGVSATNAAGWNGTAWRSLGLNVDAHVLTVTDYLGDLVIAGTFQTIGGDSCKGLAGWNGSTWGTIDTGGSECRSVDALATYNSELICCVHTRCGGCSDCGSDGGPERWDGEVWKGLWPGPCVVAPVEAIAEYNGELVAGGSGGLARWNGEVWETFAGSDTAGALGNPYFFSAMTLYNGNLVVGAVHNDETASSRRTIATWDGNQWSELGEMNERIQTLTAYNGDLIAGGSFDQVDGVITGRIARWNGAAWEAMGGGLGGTVRTLHEYNGELYAGGDSLLPNGQDGWGLAKWNGADWQPVTPFENVYSLGSFQGQLFIGTYYWPGADPEPSDVSSIFAWDLTSTTQLASAENGYFYDFMEYLGEMVVTGWFPELVSDGVGWSTPIAHIARWDGQIWKSVGSGLSGAGKAFTLFSDSLIVAGDLDGGVAAWNKQPSLCCLGYAGNVDSDPLHLVDLGDLTALIDYLFISFTEPECIEEANVDGGDGGIVDLGDLTALIDYLFISFTPPAPCP